MDLDDEKGFYHCQRWHQIAQLGDILPLANEASLIGGKMTKFVGKRTKFFVKR